MVIVGGSDFYKGVVLLGGCMIACTGNSIARRTKLTEAVVCDEGG